MNRIYLVRHGENKANITKEFSCKKVDYPLTAKGVLQAKQTAAFFASVAVDELYSSPLVRAFQTAMEISQTVGKSISVIEEFREVNVGDLEDMPPDHKSWGIYNGVISEWLNGNYDVAFPGGENRHSLSGRMRSGLQKAISGKTGKNIVIVGHGGIFTNGVIDICENADADTLLAVENHNCSISVVSGLYTEGNLRCVLEKWADIDHLNGEAANFVSAVPAYENSEG